MGRFLGDTIAEEVSGVGKRISEVEDGSEASENSRWSEGQQWQNKYDE